MINYLLNAAARDAFIADAKHQPGQDFVDGVIDRVEVLPRSTHHPDTGEELFTVIVHYTYEIPTPPPAP